MRILAELKRRNVYRAAIAYLAVAWLILQVNDVVAGIIGAPAWIQQSLLATLAVGFPIALVLAWVYEWTPDGIRVESATADSEAAPDPRRQRLSNRLLIGVLVTALVVLLIDEFWIDHRPAAELGTTIAVLPFDNRSANDADAFFVEGIHDDILAQLGKIASIRVISRTSVQRFTDTTLSIPEIADALGASVVLEGAVQRAGDRVRVNVTLVDAKRDEQVWSQPYDRALDTRNIFEIQSEIAAAVAAAMRAQLTAEEESLIGVRPTDNLQAYEALLLGRTQLNQQTARSIRDANRYFSEAVEIDPKLAEAWAGLAEALRQQWEYEERRNPALIQQANEAIETALSIRTDVAEAYETRAWIKHDLGDETGAEDDTLRALALNPNLAVARALLADLLFHHFGRQDEAYRELERAMATDPLSARPRELLAQFFITEGRYDDARQVLLKIREVAPDSARASIWLALGAALDGEGRIEEGLELLLEAVSLDPENPSAAAFVAAFLSDLGELDLALDWVEFALAVGPDHYEPHDVGMYVRLYRGETDTGLALARRAVELNPRYPSALPIAVLNEEDSRQGRPEIAVERMEAAFPELRDDEVSTRNYKAAIELARVSLLAGDELRARSLLDKVPDLSGVTRFSGPGGLYFYEVRLHAVQGDMEAALAALERANDNELLSLWTFTRDIDPAFAELRKQARFLELAGRFDARAAAHRARVVEWAAEGNNLEPPRTRLQEEEL